MSFPVILRELREKRGLSQEDLADKLGIPRSSIAHYEQPEQTRLPRRQRLEDIADFFGVDLDYLLGRKEKESEYPLPESEFEKIVLQTEKEFNIDLRDDPDVREAFRELVRRLAIMKQK